MRDGEGARAIVAPSERDKTWARARVRLHPRSQPAPFQLLRWDKARCTPASSCRQMTAHEYVRCRHASLFQERMKILGNRCAGSRERTWIAPAYASPVIPARLRKLGGFGLYWFPFKTWAVSTGLENHCRPTGSRAGDVEGPASDIHRPPDLRETFSIFPSSELLINHAGQENRRDHKSEVFHDVSQAPFRQGFLLSGCVRVQLESPAEGVPNPFPRYETSVADDEWHNSADDRACAFPQR